MTCLGTGPSLTLQQIEAARRKGFHLVGVNNVHQIVPDLEVLFATNGPWWDWYWGRHDGPREHPCEKWTNDRDAAAKYGLKHIESLERRGLSKTLDYIHHGHSSGFCLLNLAYLMGATRIVLLGYDMRFAPDYDGKERKIGCEPRHYFGEYPSALQHWPKVSVKEGIHLELVEQYATVARQGLVEIINCTGPNSALDCFPRAEIESL